MMDETPPEGVTVLIVDEPGKELTLLTEVASGMGLTVKTAPSLKDALSIIRKTPPDIVVTDLLSPRINGWDLAEELASDHPEVSVVVMTSRIWQSAEQILTDLSIDGYLLKPLDPRRVKTLLRTLTVGIAQRSGKIVVVVDGDQGLLDKVNGWLAPTVYEVHTYAAMPKAEADIKADPPDLLVIDRKIGPFDGLSLIRDIRQTPWTDHIPVVLTGLNLGREEILRAAKMKVNTILSKPYGEADLLKRLDALANIGPGA